MSIKWHHRIRYSTTPCGKLTETNIDDIKIDVNNGITELTV